MSIEVFRKMINSYAIVQLTAKHSKYSITLTEPALVDSSVEISGVPYNSIAIKIDKFPSPDKLFAGGNGECKRADFALIADNGSKKRIIIIELKRTKTSRNHIEEQLKGAACVIEYCKEIAKRFYNCDNVLSGFEIRYVSFCHTSIAKKKTRIDRSSRIPNEPNKMMKISSPNYINFNLLAN